MSIVTPEAEGRPMASDLKAVLAKRAEDIKAYVEKIALDRRKAAEFLEVSPVRIAAAERDLGETRATLAMLTGEPVLLKPGNITPHDGLGLQIGALLLAPPAGAPAEQLRLYAATMRTLYEEATHQARLATDAADAVDPEGARIRNLALAPTQAFQAVKLNGPMEAGVCRHCRVEIYKREGLWVHFDDGHARCAPDLEDSLVADPVESACVCRPDAPAPDPWCAVHPSYPTAPAVGQAATLPDVEAADA